MNVTTAHRDAAVGGLVASILLLSASAVTQPALGDSASAKLAAIDHAGATGALSAATFALGQLPFIAAALGIGHLLRRRSPRLGFFGSGLAVVGAFGHAVFGGVSLAYLFLADGFATAEPAQRAVSTAAVTDLESSPVMVFALLGLAGTVVGVLLLSIGLFRGRVGPRWVGPALWAFLLTEFVGGAVSDRASYVSCAFGLAAFLALARTARRDWDLRDADHAELVTGVARRAA